MLGADVLKGGGTLGIDVKRLIGNVSFKHENAIMYCDSAHFNSNLNIVDAYSKIHIVQGDSLHLYGDLLKYNGNTKMANVRLNVRLIHSDASLTTDSLDFDRNINRAHYFNYGKIVDVNNNLTSTFGYYYSDTKDYFAINKVVLINKKYKMYSDTLKYNTNTDISYFFGPTEIISDSNYIYCENGWYDTYNDVSQFNKNAYFLKGAQKLSGDSLYYNRKKGLGKAFINVEIIDTTQKVTILGQKATYFENPEVATVTDSAVFIQISDNDTLFLHADTLRIRTYTDTIFYNITDTFSFDNPKTIDNFIKTNKLTTYTIDTIAFKTDTNSIIETKKLILLQPSDSLQKHKKVFAFKKARIYKSNLQCKTDSIMYLFKDSVIQFFGTPVLWSDENQISADYIELFMKNNEANHFYMKAKAIIVSQDDTIRFNQISGKEIYGYFKENEIYMVKVFGNAESVYYTREDNKDTTSTAKGDLIGPNVANGSNMTIYLRDRKPFKIIYFKSPDGALNPDNYKAPKELYLKNFSWQIEKRPVDKFDIFIWK